MGMSRASIYRRIKLFRIAFGAHPDEFVMPGVTLDLAAYRRAGRRARRAKETAAQSRNSETVRPSRSA